MTVYTLVCTAVAFAATASAQQPPPVRPLGPIVKVSSEPLSSVAAVRQLSDGRVLVNDIVAHRVVLLGSTLSKATVVADSTSATANAYGARPGGLIAYRGDTTMFVDSGSLSILVLSPAGRIQRVISAPMASGPVPCSRNRRSLSASISPRASSIHWAGSGFHSWS